MPIDYPQAETDLHKGTYQVGTAPKTLQQKAQEAALLNRANLAAGSKQKVKTYAPGQDPSIRAQIEATPADKPISFSDQ